MNKFLKQFLLVMAVATSAFLASAINPQKASAVTYEVALTTYVPTASSGDYTLGAYPNIANNLYVRQLIVSNNSATAQRITVYNNCTSSAAADTVTAIMDLPATIGTYYFPPNLITPQGFPLTNPCFNRSATTGNTNITVIYE
ncbi:hypothetical protein KW797_02585 [Candidatus Parcubacteria bacterium]|nr:hypothetical protein [Candidatus Parcubacteria bacterium]